jgi:phage I-like protein
MADIETIINVLGLEAGSDAEAAVAAIEALKAQNALLQETMKADAPEKEAVAQMRTDLQSAQQRLLEMDAEHNRNTLQLREKVRTMEAEARVDKAIAQGRVTPANRDYALRVAISETEEGWNNFVRTLPSVNLKELGTAVGFDNEAYEPTQEEIAIARQMGQWDDADPGASRVALMRAKGAKIPAEK